MNFVTAVFTSMSIHGADDLIDYARIDGVVTMFFVIVADIADCIGNIDAVILFVQVFAQLLGQMIESILFGGMLFGCRVRTRYNQYRA